MATIDLARIIRARGIPKFKGRLPRPIPPSGIEIQYTTDLHRLTHRLAALTDEYFIPRMAHNVARNPRVKKDGFADDLFGDLKKLKVLFEREFTDEELLAIAKKNGQSLADFNRNNLNRTFERAIGINLFGSEPWLEDTLSLHAINNVQLIKTIPDRYFNDVSAILYQGIKDGTQWEELADEIRGRYQVSDWNAERIARDQVGKLNGQLNEERQTDVGVDDYTWRGVLDQRERDEHVAHEGQKFSWDDPPADTGHPGEDILCRCWGEPDLDKFWE